MPVFEPDSVALLTAAVAPGAGTAQSVRGYQSIRLEVWGTGTFAVKFQASAAGGSGAYYDIQAMDLTTMALTASVAAAGIFEIDVVGLSSVRVNVTAVTGGSVSAAGKLVE